MMSSPPFGQWIGVGLTDVGLVRTVNQDAFSLDNDLQLWVLADGMGGHAGGDVASSIAVQTIPRVVRSQCSTDSSRPVPPDEYASILCRAIESANQAIRQQAEQHPSLQGMGTTVVVAAITCLPTGYHAIVAHAGDSRAYLLREDQLFLWTRDHSLVEERLALNLLTSEQARSHPLRHVLTNALGIDPHSHPTIQTFPLEPSDRILLCSDGLTKMLTDQEIQGIAMQTPSPLASICRTLIATANQTGGEDNTTVVLIGLNSNP